MRVRCKCLQSRHFHPLEYKHNQEWALYIWIRWHRRKNTLGKLVPNPSITINPFLHDPLERACETLMYLPHAKRIRRHGLIALGHVWSHIEHTGRVFSWKTIRAEICKTVGLRACTTTNWSERIWHIDEDTRQGTWVTDVPNEFRQASVEHAVSCSAQTWPKIRQSTLRLLCFIRMIIISSKVQLWKTKFDHLPGNAGNNPAMLILP